MDFYKIRVKELKDGTLQLYPDFLVGRSKDLMVRGKSFYAIWDEEIGLWSKDEYDVVRLIDAELHAEAEKRAGEYQVLNLRSYGTKSWTQFQQFMKNISDNSHSLDEKLTFANTEVKKSDYASKRLPYSLEPGPIDAWDELVGTLYSDEERAKIEWAIGAVVSGDAKKLQKFLVFYGPAGSGKSTILNIIQSLFEGYVTTFDAKALGGNNNAFATEVFKDNPLVAIQHDGDLSRIDDNTKLNSIISHEEMTMNEKYKPSYSARVNAFLFMGTNQPVKISDAKSGLIRRLIDVHPTGLLIDPNRYHILMSQIEFELGAIAHHCLERYKQMGKNYYNTYRPIEMMLQTDVFYNYVEANYHIFRTEDGVALKRAWALYKEFCAETGIDKLLPQYKFREELRNYFDEFKDKANIEGVQVRSYYSGFKGLDQSKEFVADFGYSVDLHEADGKSVFDLMYPDQPAQYADEKEERPKYKWANAKTTLKDIDTTKLHYVKIPENHIVIDFDCRDEEGNKSIELSLAAAADFPPTYAELSRSGNGLHLHYIWNGDVHELSNVYDKNIEVKTLLGDESLRRKLTKCNNLEVATISAGLVKKEKSMISEKQIKSEKNLRALIERNLKKQIHPGTKPSIDFIKKILDDAWESDLVYDVRDMRPNIIGFAARSTNHASACISTVQEMKFVSEVDTYEPTLDGDDSPLVFFDVEVYPNLFVVCWKSAGGEVVKMINPSSEDMGELFRKKLVGFNNRRYDNHILYARYLGYDLKELYNESVKLINNVRSAFFGEAYNLSYTDIYDFSSKKQSLKKFEIELGLHHMELDLPWDKPVPEDKWDLVVEYCANDVVATEATFDSRKQDFVARQILSELSGLSVNHSTQSHTARIIFGKDKNPQKSFVYTDLSEEFPGYQFTGKESVYREEVTGEGGYVYAEPGIYSNVALLDVASMHPTSIERLNLFGPYTERFSDLKSARMAIKHKDYDKASTLLDGRLKPFINDNMDGLEDLSYALKIVINIVYGLTSAKFDNPFRDIHNVDNIVAKRGALFMIDLKHAVQEKGFRVAHIKTDSIKIPNATKGIIDFIIDFGKKYGYDFEHEATYDRFCLVNDAVYVAGQYLEDKIKWTAVGAQFQKPYVYKSLFTGEEITFDDLTETKSVTQGAMYLDFTDSDDPDVSKMVHVGRTGSFVPVVSGGGTLYRVKDDRYFAVTGTKGYKWIETEIASNKDDLDVDLSYFEDLKQKAVEAIEEFGSFSDFVS